jgi:perosamine synthetase
VTGVGSGDEDDLEALRCVLQSGRFGSEDDTVAFEQALVAHTGLGHAVTTSSGSAAIELALRALEIGHGAEVVVPAFTCRSVSDAVHAAGATPVYADVVWPSGTVDAQTVDRAVGSRSRAVIAVDVYGAPAPIAQIAEITRRRGLSLIVDVAQSFGNRWATDGDITVTSFHPSKVLAAGEGGAMLTNDGDLADRVRYLRSPGALQVRLGRPVDGGIGRSMRMSDLDAALARSRLARVGSVLAQRRNAAARWIDELDRAGVPVTYADPEGHAFSCLPVALDDRADRTQLLELLHEVGVAAHAGYPALHHPTAGFDPCPSATHLAKVVVCLPTHPGVTGGVTDGVTDRGGPTDVQRHEFMTSWAAGTFSPHSAQ